MTCNCHNCAAYTTSTRRRIIGVLCVLALLTGLYLLTGDPLLSLAATFLGGGWMGDYIA